MPELPEVETVMRGMMQAILGKKITSCVLNVPALRVPFGSGFIPGVTGSHIAGMQRRGKYIISALDNGRSLIWHLGMSGRVRIFVPGDSYMPIKHDHAVFHFSNGVVLAYNDPRRFGFIRLEPSSAIETTAPFNKMGPEPLIDDFDGPALWRQLQRRKNLAVKVALLDQGIVAGVGNIYACESLYSAGINPQRLSGTIKPAEAQKLAAAIKVVLEDAIAAGGSTLRDYAQTDGSAGYFQHNFKVYDHQGEPCPRCVQGSQKGDIQRIVQAGRSTFFCPKCQK